MGEEGGERDFGDRGEGGEDGGGRVKEGNCFGREEEWERE